MLLDGDHYRTAELVSQLMSNAQNQAMFDLIESLNPEFTIVRRNTNNAKYCYNYKGIIRGEGSTVYEAMVDFSKNFYNQKP